MPEVSGIRAPEQYAGPVIASILLARSVYLNAI